MNKPPKWPFRLLRIFCPDQLFEEIEGDLFQRWEKDFKNTGKIQANVKLFWNAIRFFRFEILARHKFSTNKKMPHMWNHFFLTYSRNSIKNLSTTALNLLGLTIGLGSALVMSFFVIGELNFDRWENSGDVYRVVFGEDDESGSAFTPFVLGTDLKNSYPGVKSIRFNNAGNARVNFKLGDKQFVESSFYFVDPDVFEVFPFKLLEGNSKTSLNEPFTMVLTQRASRKYFGDESPVGKSISVSWIDQDYELKITGLIDENAFHSHIRFDYLISIATAERLFRPASFFTDWTANYNVTYLSIDNPATADIINHELSTLYKNNTTQRTSDFLNLRLQPFNRIHLYSHLSRELGSNADVKYVYLAESIAILILLICLINYVNLMMAQFRLRLKEIGIRKSLGASRSGVLQQFLSESLINVVIALMLAVILVVLCLPLIAKWTSNPWTIIQLIHFRGVWVSIVTLLGVAIMTGIYPSWVVSHQNAGDILYGRLKLMKGSWSKNVLVAIQFFIALFILTCALIVRKQLDFVQHKDLGYDHESLLTIPHGRAIRERSESIKQKLMQTGLVVSSSLSSQLPSRGLGYKVPARVEGGNPDGSPEPWPVSIVSVDYDFFKTFSLSLADGRTFSAEFPSDSTEAFVINEAAARALNWTSSLDKEIEVTYNVGNGTVETRKGKVIGVIRDFNFESLHKTIEPIVFMCKPFWFYYVSLKLKPGITIADVEQLSQRWKTLVPDKPFEYTLMTERLEELYLTERAWAIGINFFSIVTVLISSLGLLGLISFIIQSRMKEIAIKKVLGAESFSVFLKLSSSVLMLNLIAAVAALPVAFLVSQLWLEGFAYRTEVNATVFLIALFLVMGISMLTVFSKILRASTINPAEILKSE